MTPGAVDSGPLAEDDVSSESTNPFLGGVTFGMAPRVDIGLYTDHMVILMPVQASIVAKFSTLWNVLN